MKYILVMFLICSCASNQAVTMNRTEKYFNKMLKSKKIKLTINNGDGQITQSYG